MNTNTITNETPYASYREAIAAAGSYGREDKELLLWAVDTAEERRMTLPAIAAEAGISTSSVARMLTGAYGAKPDKMLAAFRTWRTRHEARQDLIPIPFIETALARQVWDGIQYAAAYEEIVSLIGRTQWGKTEACREYRRRRQLEGDNGVVLVTLPPRPALFFVSRLVARELGLEPKGSYALNLEQVCRTLTHRHVLVVDEAHEVAMGRDRGSEVIEMFRYMKERTGCALVFVGTEVWRDCLDGRWLEIWKSAFAQTVQRGIVFRLTTELPDEDIAAVWRAFGLPDPGEDKVGRGSMEVIREVLKSCSFGRYTKRMRAAATTAARRGEAYAWEHFLGTHRFLQEREER